MSFFDTIGSNLTKAIDYVVEKNRKTAIINRLKIVIKSEENNAERAYIALGKHYYHNLRDEQNPNTESYCSQVDHSIQRLERAFIKLDELTAAEEPEDKDDMCMDCDDDCQTCAYYEDEYDEFDSIHVDEDLQKDNEKDSTVLHADFAFKNHEENGDSTEESIPEKEEPLQKNENSDEAAEDSYGDNIPTDK